MSFVTFTELCLIKTPLMLSIRYCFHFFGTRWFNCFYHTFLKQKADIKLFPAHNYIFNAEGSFHIILVPKETPLLEDISVRHMKSFWHFIVKIDSSISQPIPVTYCEMVYLSLLGNASLRHVCVKDFKTNWCPLLRSNKHQLLHRIASINFYTYLQ